MGNIPFSYFANKFLPDARGAHKEFERIESNVGRYTHGFRHYENYYNYLQKYPDATVLDYQNDSKFFIYYFNFNFS